ncbi:MAG: FMN-dependent L-lactate dehydrogenase LldD [Pseudomonadota bacterium]|nr:FMN-dependent L-lactate dehydrogenase LldD [Pseudomonadota bacterium]
MIIASPGDFRGAARRKLPRFLFDYIDGGAGAEVTLQHNTRDLAELMLRQRVLSGATASELETNLFGRRQALPIALAPVGLTGMYARRGEVQAARAAALRGIPFCLSSMSVCSLDEVAAASRVPFWFQLYVLRDRGATRALVASAKAAGCSALVVTVDLPLPGLRYRDAHSGMSGPRAAARRYLQAMTHPAWAWDVGLMGRPHSLGNVAPLLGKTSGLEDFIGWLGANFDPSVHWRDLEWIRQCWDGPLIIKGILDCDDARSAVEAGADGIVVSNHGGRQLDGAVSTARALPAIVDAVGDRVTVLADSGIRCGADVVRLLALGAKGVLIGRAWVYALAARGQVGVTQVIDMLAKEILVTMTLAGVSTVSQISGDVLAPAPRHPA